MGQGSSHELFVRVLKSMLKAQGAKVGREQLERFLDFVTEVSPWFPGDGTVNLETWQRVEERLHAHHTAQGPQKVPVDTFSLWNLIKDCLDPRHEKEKWQSIAEGGGGELSQNPETAEENKERRKIVSLCLPLPRLPLHYPRLL